MLHAKNLLAWERWGRGLIGVGLVVLGVTAQWGTLAVAPCCPPSHGGER
jgi:hypothetical protein